jgi:predicted kinase
MMIFVIGAHGCGKSTLVHRVVEEWPGWWTSDARRNRQASRMLCQRAEGESLTVIGHYAYGKASGPDSGRFSGRIPEIYQWLRVAHEKGQHALVEGTVLVGTLKRALELPHHALMYVHIDEPLETCVEGIRARKARRRHKHDAREIDTKMIASRARQARNVLERVGEFGIKTLSGSREFCLQAVLTEIGLSGPHEHDRRMV